MTEIDRERQSHRSTADDQDRVFAHANARSSFVTSVPIAATTSTVIRLMANQSQATGVGVLEIVRGGGGRLKGSGVEGKEPILLQFISLRIEKGPLTARNGLWRCASRLWLGRGFIARTNITRIYSSLVFRSQCDHGAGAGDLFLPSSASIQTSQGGWSPKRRTRKSTKLRTFGERWRSDG